jgi:Domain of unknown function (DUF4124)
MGSWAALSHSRSAGLAELLVLQIASGRSRIDILFYPAHRGSAMHARPVSIALVAVSLTIGPGAAMSEIYKWIEADGSVHYSNTPPPRTKNVRLVGQDSGTVSVVPGMSKEEKDRLREREDQLRLQRLEREVEELRAREQAREYTQPEVVYTDVYVPAYGYWRPRHGRDIGHVKPRPEHPIAKPRPPQRTQPVEELSAVPTPTGGLSRR